jgi:hypothetical protein
MRWGGENGKLWKKRMQPFELLSCCSEDQNLLAVRLLAAMNPLL